MSTNTWSTALSWSETVKLCVAAEFAESAPHPPEAALEKIQADPSRAVEMMEENRTWITQLLDAREACKAPIQDIALFASNDERVLSIAAKIAKGTTEEHQALVDEIRRSISRLIANESTDPEFLEDGGILTWDEHLAAFLEQNGRQDMAKVVRASASKRRKQWDQDHKASRLWFIWQDPTRYATAIGTAVWPSVKARLDKKGEKPDALTILAVKRVAINLVSSKTVPSRIEGHNGQIELFTRKDEALGHCKVSKEEILAWESSPKLRRSQVLKLAFDGYGLLDGVTSLRFFFWLTKQSQQHNRDEITTIALWVNSGGWEFLAEEIGSPDKGADLRRIAHAYWRTVICLPEWTGTLISLEEFGGKGRSVSKIKIEPQSIFQMHFDKELKDNGILSGRKLDQMSTLVPITGMPSAVGRPNEYAKLGLLWLGVCAAMAEDSPVIASRGCVIDDSRLTQLCDSTGLPLKTGRKALEAWVERGELACVGQFAYDLGDVHATHRAWLHGWGGKRIARSENGAKGAGARRSKIER